MHIVFIEPRFPANQKLFIKALAEVGATVTAIGEGSKDSLDDELKHWLSHYEEVRNVTDESQVMNAVKTNVRSSACSRRTSSRRTCGGSAPSRRCSCSTTSGGRRAACSSCSTR